MASLNENGSLTDLVNSALVGIGDNTIENLMDANDGKAKLCRLLVTQCIREVQGHPSACWSELDSYEILVPNDRAYRDDAPSYNVPKDCLSIRWVKDGNNLRIPYKVSARSLKTPYRAKHICYVRFSDNPEEWSSELKSCVIGLLSAKLLAAIAKDYTASRQAVDSFWMVEFPRWAGNRMNHSDNAVPGKDSELSELFGEDPHSALHAKDWI